MSWLDLHTDNISFNSVSFSLNYKTILHITLVYALFLHARLSVNIERNGVFLFNKNDLPYSFSDRLKRDDHNIIEKAIIISSSRFSPTKRQYFSFKKKRVCETKSEPKQTPSFPIVRCFRA